MGKLPYFGFYPHKQSVYSKDALSYTVILPCLKNPVNSNLNLQLLPTKVGFNEFKTGRRITLLQFNKEGSEKMLELEQLNLDLQPYAANLKELGDSL